MKKFSHKIRVLYLNCIPANSQAILKALRRSDQDFDINLFHKTEELEKRVNAFNPEVVIVDQEAEVASLIDALNTVRKINSALPFILITNFDSEEVATTLMKAGATDYLFIERPNRLPMAVVAAVEVVASERALTLRRDQSTKEFSHLVDNLPVGFSLWNKDRHLVYFNQAMLSFSFSGNVGAPQPFDKLHLDIYDANNNSFSLERDLVFPTLRHGERIVHDDLYILKHDGSKRYITIFAIPTKKEESGLTGAMVLFLDVTDQKLAQVKIKALSELLQTKNNELGQFAYIISHNLRDPIAKILGLASICDTPSDDSRFIVKKITEEANRLDSVVKDLNVIVSVRNVEKEKMESLIFDRELSLVSQVLKKEILNSKAMIETDFQELHEIFTVKSYLHSVLYNLLSNSIKYRDINKPLAITMRTYKIGQYACLSVRDNGLGIDLNKNGEKVFGLYKRFHSENIPGKGVGLHFIKRYAEALGGKVEIDSKPHEGTELKVYFLNQR